MNNLPDDYFLDAHDELVAFLEKQGEDCIREIQQSNALNKENGQKLLSILIVGVDSSFLLLTQRTGFDYLTAGMSVFLLYWTMCAAYLVRRVLVVGSRALVSSTPHALYHEGYKGFTEDDYSAFESKGFSATRSTLNVLRRYRLADLTRMAEMSKKENARIGRELERVRIATILIPVCALVISVLTFFPESFSRITDESPAGTKVPLEWRGRCWFRWWCRLWFRIPCGFIGFAHLIYLHRVVVIQRIP